MVLEAAARLTLGLAEHDQSNCGGVQQIQLPTSMNICRTEIQKLALLGLAARKEFSPTDSAES